MTRGVRCGSRGKDHDLRAPGGSCAFDADADADAAQAVPPVRRRDRGGGGEIFGAEQDLGTVEPGRLADLTVVDGDPFTDFDRLARTDRALIAGRVHERAARERAYAGTADRTTAAASGDWADGRRPDAPRRLLLTCPLPGREHEKDPRFREGLSSVRRQGLEPRTR
ncbi:hypothetical protein [Streptomyces enissocaesilis]|uniref:Amidohydrolase-related domain-containing protein n=1 Tax=Streptomyces enissocaesilis TaxID=332589 RepID=A0ABN3XHX9_9ACTN